MNREADEKLRQAVREWLDASPAPAACLIVGQPDDGPPVWLMVGTEEQIRTNISGYRQLKAERDNLAGHLCAVLLEHDAGGVTLNTWGDVRQAVGELEAARLT